MKNKGRVLIALAAVTAFLAFMAGAEAAIIDVRPGESIQAAVNSASSGDAIHVQSGAYRESLNISKPIVLEGRGRPLLDSGAIGSAIVPARAIRIP